MTESLNGKRVLVTGAGGFIGSHLVERRAREGAQVCATVYSNSWNGVGWLADAAPEVMAEAEVLAGDIRDAERVRRMVAGCDYAFHLSSLIGIPYSYDAPRSYLGPNITGALDVLEACRHSDRLTRLVHTSASEILSPIPCPV